MGRVHWVLWCTGSVPGQVHGPFDTYTDALESARNRIVREGWSRIMILKAIGHVTPQPTLDLYGGTTEQVAEPDA